MSVLRVQAGNLRSAPQATESALEIARPSSRAADYRDSRASYPARKQQWAYGRALAALLPYRAISDYRVSGRLLLALGPDLKLRA